MSLVRIRLVDKHVRPNKPDLLRPVCWFAKDDGRPWMQAPPPMRDRQSEALGNLLDHRDFAKLLESFATAAADTMKHTMTRDTRTAEVLKDSPCGGKLLEVPGLTVRWEKVTAVLDRIADTLDDGSTATLTVDQLRRLTS